MSRRNAGDTVEPPATDTPVAAVPIGEMPEAQVKSEMAALQAERDAYVAARQDLWDRRERARIAGRLEEVAEIDAARVALRDAWGAGAPLLSRRFDLLDMRLTALAEAAGTFRHSAGVHSSYWLL